MVKPHMPQAVVVSCETSVRVLATLILAQKFATLFDDAVTTRRVTIQILHPIKALGPATRNLASEVTAVSLEMFAVQPSVTCAVGVAGFD